MMLPTKHIPPDQTLMGVGALLLKHLDQPRTVSALWEQVKDQSPVGTFDRFILGLDMLHIIGSISHSNGMLVRMNR